MDDFGLGKGDKYHVGVPLDETGLVTPAGLVGAFSVMFVEQGEEAGVSRCPLLKLTANSSRIGLQEMDVFVVKHGV